MRQLDGNILTSGPFDKWFSGKFKFFMSHASAVTLSSSSNSFSSSAAPPLPDRLEERMRGICLSSLEQPAEKLSKTLGNQLSFDVIRVRHLNEYCRYNGESNLKGEPHGRGELKFAYPLVNLNSLYPPFGEKNNVIFIVYKGSFDRGEAHGKAEISFENGPSKIFEGEFNRGCLVRERRQREDGSFRLIRIFHTSLAPQCSYFGDLDSDGKFQGEGWFIFRGGDFYVGSFNKGQFHGMGERVFSNGAFYRGPFLNDVRTTELISKADCEKEHVAGKEPENQIAWLRYENGATYRGEFTDNRPLGRGEIAMPNQLSAIKGIFSDYGDSHLSRCFHREIFFDDAKPPFLFSYEGFFSHKHLPSGRGIYTFADGTVLQGIFETASMTSTGNIEAIKLLPSGERRIGLFEERKLKLNVPASAAS